MKEKHLKKCSTSLAIKEMQIKMTLRFNLMPFRMVKIKPTNEAHAKRMSSKGNTLPLWVGLQTYTLEINMMVPLEIGNQFTLRPSIFPEYAQSYHKDIRSNMLIPC